MPPKDLSHEYSLTPQDILMACKLGFWAFKKNGQHVLGSGVSEILGLSSKTPTFENFISTIHPQDLDGFLNSPVGMTVGKWPLSGPTASATFDFRVNHSGSVRYIQGRAQIRSDKDGAAEEVVGVLEDVTEYKLMEKQRFETQERLAQLGQMVATIIHEINTPLTVMSFYAQSLEHEAAESPPDVAKVQLQAGHISRLSLKMAKMMRSMKFYMAPRVNREFEMATLSSIFKEAMGLCEEKLRQENVTISAAIPESLSLECRPIQLCQVLTNLLINSVEAIRLLPERWIHVEAREEKQKVIIQVTDSGLGIPPEIARLIMLPFFTTRENEGTGLGLPLCCELADQHHGSLRYDEHSTRTTFVLDLPMRQPGPR